MLLKGFILIVFTAHPIIVLLTVAVSHRFLLITLTSDDTTRSHRGLNRDVIALIPRFAATNEEKEFRLTHCIYVHLSPLVIITSIQGIYPRPSTAHLLPYYPSSSSPFPQTTNKASFPTCLPSESASPSPRCCVSPFPSPPPSPTYNPSTPFI